MLSLMFLTACDMSLLLIQGCPRGNRVTNRNRLTANLLGDPGPGELLELAGVGVELADALAQLLDGHGVLVVHPAELLLVQVDPRRVRALGGFDAQAARELAWSLLQL